MINTTALIEREASATYNAANHQRTFGSQSLTYHLNGNLMAVAALLVAAALSAYAPSSSAAELTSRGGCGPPPWPGRGRRRPP